MRPIALECDPADLRLRAGGKDPVRVVLKSTNGLLPPEAEVKVTHGKLMGVEQAGPGKLAVTVMPPKRSGVLGVLVSAASEGKIKRYRLGLPVDTTALGFVWEMVESLGVALVLVVLIKAFLFQLFYIPSGSMEPTLFEGDRIVATPLPYHLHAPRRGDVVIFRAPQEASPHRNRDEIDLYFFELPMPGFFRRSNALEIGPFKWRYPYRLKHRVDDFIKRCVAVAGDTVQLKGGYLYVNGKRVNERVWEPGDPGDFGRGRYLVGQPSKGTTDYVLAERPRDEYIRVNGIETTRPVKVPKGKIFVLGDNRNNSHDGHKWGFLNVDRVVAQAKFIILPPGRMGRIP